MIKNKSKFVKSSEKVFKDIGFTEAHSKIDLEKAEILSRIDKLVLALPLGYLQLPGILDIHPTAVDELLCGRLRLFSINRLRGFLYRITQWKNENF